MMIETGNPCSPARHFPGKRTFLLLILAVTSHLASANEFHVSVTGGDQNKGSASKPFRTISAAANVAQPGDVITVHEGVYRERIDPPRGGTSDTQAHRLPGRAGREGRDQGVGSRQELGEGPGAMSGRSTLPNAFFGSFNPYSDLIHGDWFNPQGPRSITPARFISTATG